MHRLIIVSLTILLLTLPGCSQLGRSLPPTAELFAAHQDALRHVVIRGTQELLRRHPLLRPAVMEWSAAANAVLQTANVRMLRPALLSVFPKHWNTDTHFWMTVFVDVLLAQANLELESQAIPANAQLRVGHILGWIHKGAQG